MPHLRSQNVPNSRRPCKIKTIPNTELADRSRVLFPGMNLIDSNRTLIQPREQDTETQYSGQLYKIFSIRGTPHLHLLPADVAGFLYWETVPRFRRANLLRRFPMLGVSGNRLLARLLSYSSVERLSAAAAIGHDFFDEELRP